MAKEEVLIDIKLDAEESTESINSLRAAVREMTKARNDANLTTAEGRAQVQSLNQAIDANNAKIKSNIDSLTKQKMNVGNYKKDIQDAIPALDQFTGGAVSAGQGILTMTKQALAFIATPLGAVIAAVGLAVSALTAYFKGSEEGQDRLAKITATLNVAMSKLMVVFESIGEAVWDTVTGVGSMTDKLGIFGVALDIVLAPLKLLYEGLKLISDVSGFTKIVEDTVKAGESIADLYDSIEARENELVVLRAETSAKVLELREKAITQEGEAKRKTVQQAIDLAKALAAEEKKNLVDKLRAFDLEAAATGKLTEEQKAKRAELVAAIINAESEGAQATIKFQKEIERLRDAENKKIEEKIKLEDAAALAEGKRQETLDIANQKERDRLLEASERANQYLEIDKWLNDERASVDADYEESKKQQLESEILRKQREVAAETQKQSLLKQLALSGIALAGQLFSKNKGISSAIAGLSTYLTAQKAYESQFLPVPDITSPVRGAIAAGIALVQGLGNIASINGIQFSKGGLVQFNNGGLLNGPSHANGGIAFSVGGRLGFEAEGGEAIINKRSTAMFRPMLSAINAAGGGVQFAEGGITGFPSSMIDTPTSSPFDLTRLESFIANLKIYTAIEDVNDGQKNYAEITDRAQF